MTRCCAMSARGAGGRAGLQRRHNAAHAGHMQRTGCGRRPGTRAGGVVVGVGAEAETSGVGAGVGTPLMGLSRGPGVGTPAGQLASVPEHRLAYRLCGLGPTHRPVQVCSQGWLRAELGNRGQAASSLRCPAGVRWAKAAQSWDTPGCVGVWAGVGADKGEGTLGTGAVGGECAGLPAGQWCVGARRLDLQHAPCRWAGQAVPCACLQATEHQTASVLS